MTTKRGLGVAFAFVCLGLLGVMPILAADRPPAYDGLTFTIWLTFWQLACALPLMVIELARGRRVSTAAAPPRRRARTVTIALVTGAMFGLSTYMYVVAAAKAGPVSMAIALQSYPLFAILLEAFLGKRKTPLELALTAAIAALLYLTTNGTFALSEVSWWSVYALGIPLLWGRRAPAAPQRAHHGGGYAEPDNRIATPDFGRVPARDLCRLGQTGGISAGLADLNFQKAAFLLGLTYYAELIFWFHAMRHIDVSLGSSIIVPAPALTMAIAVVLGGIAIETHQVLAMAVIVAALYGLLLAGRRKQMAGAAA